MIFFLGSEKIELTNWKWKCRMNWTKLRKLWLSLPVINEGWLWSWWKKANQWMQLVTPKGEPMSFEKLTQPVVLTYLILRVRPSQQGISHNSRMKQHHISAWLWERLKWKNPVSERGNGKEWGERADPCGPLRMCFYFPRLYNSTIFWTQVRKD